MPKQLSSAAGLARAELEAAIWRASNRAMLAVDVDALLAYADRYAAALAEQHAGRARLEVATAEATGRA